VSRFILAIVMAAVCVAGCGAVNGANSLIQLDGGRASGGRQGGSHGSRGRKGDEKAKLGAHDLL
jgi:hypothetical protein